MIKRFFNKHGWMIFFILFGISTIFLSNYCHRPVKKYVGIVIEISSWNGNAKIKTKTEFGKDTIVSVYCRHREQFQLGQTITTWYGGNLNGEQASTSPQN